MLSLEEECTAELIAPPSTFLSFSNGVVIGVRADHFSYKICANIYCTDFYWRKLARERGCQVRPGIYFKRSGEFY